MAMRTSPSTPRSPKQRMRSGRPGEAPRGRVPLTDAYWRDGPCPSCAPHTPGSPDVPVETMPATALAATWGEAWAPDRPLLVDPFLRDPWAVPGPRGPRRPLRVGHRAPRRARRSALSAAASTSCRRSSGTSRSWRRSLDRTPGLAERLREPDVSVEAARSVRRGGGPILRRALTRSSTSTATSARTSTTCACPRGPRTRACSSPSSPSGSARPARSRRANAGRDWRPRRMCCADRARTAPCRRPDELARFEDLLADARRSAT